MMFFAKQKNRWASSLGFTLAELLIALGILGVIATFTIPKIMMNSQNSKNAAIAKEAASMFVNAYQEHKQRGLLTTLTNPLDLTPYINYVRYETTSATGFDNVYGSADIYTCADGYGCLLLHNGARVWLIGQNFNTASNLSVIRVYLDPDGIATSASATGPNQSVAFLLYYNGRLATWQTGEVGTTSGGVLLSPAAPCASCDPPWFSW